MNDTFSTYHPIINFLFFGIIVVFNVVFFSPVYLLIALSASIVYALILGGKKAIHYLLTIPIIMLIIATIINPLFVHKGITILFYINEKPITKEAIFYGFLTGSMLAGIVIWFFCYNYVMTSDKFIFLFGKVIPKSSLIFSMVLRFVPGFSAQTKIISDAQKCIGRDVSNGRPIKKVKHGSKILSIMTSWALENSIDTADSMKARGYGLPGRTNYSNFRFDDRDKAAIIFIILLCVIIIMGATKGATYFSCYPKIAMADKNGWYIITVISYGVFCYIPSILYLWEKIRWDYLR